MVSPTTTCGSCGARIFYARTLKGGLMPVDADPTDDGNLILDERGRVQVLGKADQPALFEVVRYRSHFATCPDAPEHRKRP